MKKRKQQTLKQWLDDGGMTVSELARRSGLTRQTIYNLMSGSAPSMATALAIESATSGDVPLAVWRDHHDDHQKAQTTGRVTVANR